MKIADLFYNIIKSMPSGKIFTFKLYGNSMQPALNEASILSAIKLSSNEYCVGDIVLYKDDNKIIAHRIIEMDTDMVITKGDNVVLPDPPFLKENILAKVLI